MRYIVALLLIGIAVSCEVTHNTKSNKSYTQRKQEQLAAEKDLCEQAGGEFEVYISKHEGCTGNQIYKGRCRGGKR